MEEGGCQPSVYHHFPSHVFAVCHIYSHGKLKEEEQPNDDDSSCNPKNSPNYGIGKQEKQYSSEQERCAPEHMLFNSKPHMYFGEYF